MGVQTFGVTPATVTSLYFPQVPGFNANTKPTSTAVTEMVSQSAGKLAAKLYAKDVDAEDIDDTDSAAYLTCAEQLGRMVALRVHKVLPQKFPELAKEYTREVKEWFDELNEKGATHLGDATLATGDSPANGPTSHVSENNLEQLAGVDMSPVRPLLQQKDRL